MNWILLSLLVTVGWLAIGCGVALLVSAASRVGGNLGQHTREWTRPAAPVLPLRPRL